jgi:hypothetical protein
MIRFIKKYWKLCSLILFLPIGLNYLLPIAQLSHIGGENSEVVWLNFWASYGNAIIVSIVTLFVLHKQIETNATENKNNRISADNKFTILQQKQNYKEFLDIAIKYIQLYDLKHIEYCAYENRYNCEKSIFILGELKKRMHYVWLQLSLNCKIDTDSYISFINVQQANYIKLTELIEKLIYLTNIGFWNVVKVDAEMQSKVFERYPGLEYMEPLSIENIINEYQFINETSIEEQVKVSIKKIESELNNNRHNG